LKIFPAIDLKDKKAVRLLKGDYNKVTVFNDNPVEVAKEFENSGAEYLHVVDLDGAKDGDTTNFDVVKAIIDNTSLKVEIGGGIRTEEVIKKYIDAGAFRVILGTVAITEPEFTEEMIRKYGNKIAIGVDISDGFVAVKGWTEISKVSCDELFEKMEKAGADTIICTDISKDGAMEGTNLQLYKELSEKFNIKIIASGGVSDMENIKALTKLNVFGAIVGKALYLGKVDLKEAIEVAK
jgi:phosphoribosylformimino-5-aminoimidazole carboxamide ribotide isomerase